jgi:hypothetical protein
MDRSGRIEVPREGIKPDFMRQLAPGYYRQPNLLIRLARRLRKH